MPPKIDMDAAGGLLRDLFATVAAEQAKPRHIGHYQGLLKTERQQELAETRAAKGQTQGGASTPSQAGWSKILNVQSEVES